MNASLKWRHHPAGIPRSEAVRRMKLERIRAELRRPITPDLLAEDRRRIAEQAAKDWGLGQLV